VACRGRRLGAGYGCPLIDVSTSEVYGSGGADSEDDVCTFQAPTSARKEYAVAKLAAETMLRNTAGLDVRIVRPFNVAGPRQSPTAASSSRASSSRPASGCR
jgi:nucleoside-diphosphate-sugar epimerase